MINAVFALFVLAQTAAATPELSPQAMQDLQAGTAAEKRQDFETAISEFREVIQLEPKAAI